MVWLIPNCEIVHRVNLDYILYLVQFVFRSNPTTPQLITFGNANSIRASNYAANKPLKVIVHGWSGSLNSGLNARITAAFLAAYDVNVIVVDWRALAASRYIVAFLGVPSVGEYIGNFVTWLINTGGGNWNNVHFVGFSLGAHAVGVAGRTARARPMRVTGKIDYTNEIFFQVMPSSGLKAYLDFNLNFPKNRCHADPMYTLYMRLYSSFYTNNMMRKYLISCSLR